MDESLKYMLMCEKATDIQRRWKCEQGDWVYWKKKLEKVRVGIHVVGSRIIPINNDRYSYHVQRNDYNSYDYAERKDIIWLPRQDQLQGMILEMFNPYIHLDEFYKFADKHFDFGSLEQIWLLFVMNYIDEKGWDVNKQEWVSVRGD